MPEGFGVKGSRNVSLQQDPATLALLVLGPPGVPLVTVEESPTAIVEGQVTLTGAAQQFPAEACKSITIESPSTNAVVAIGHDNAVTLLNGYRLRPGATVSMDIDNANRVWVIGTLGQIVSYIGVN